MWEQLKTHDKMYCFDFREILKKKIFSLKKLEHYTNRAHLSVPTPCVREVQKLQILPKLFNYLFFNDFVGCDVLTHSTTI